MKTMKRIQFGNTSMDYTLKESTQRMILSIAVGRDGIKVISPFNSPLTKNRGRLSSKVSLDRGADERRVSGFAFLYYFK